MNAPNQPTLRLLVANEPPLQREVLAAAIAALRPAIRVILADDAGLDAAVWLEEPQVAICSRLSAAVAQLPLGWAVLHRGAAPRAEFCLGERRATVDNPELGALLAWLDGAERLAQMSQNDHPQMNQPKLAHHRVVPPVDS